jgi:hypothetical protein
VTFHLWEVGVLILCGSIALAVVACIIGVIVVNISDELWSRKLERERAWDHKILQATRGELWRNGSITDAKFREIERQTYG